MSLFKAKCALAATAFLVLLACRAEGAETPRQVINLNSSWRFQRQTVPGSAVEYDFGDAWKPGYDDSKWTNVFIPHSWDQSDHNAWVDLNHWRGIGWYRKEFLIPPSAEGRHIELEFEGVFQVAEVWLNGQEVGSHAGGYTGFVVDISRAAKPGSKNLLAVKVDDTRSPDIPPANETNVAQYGGIYRNVWLHITDPVHIPYCGVGITTPEVSRDRSAVCVMTDVRNGLQSRSEIRLVSQLRSPRGEVVATAEQRRCAGANESVHFDQRDVTVTKPALWHPDHPSLYTLRSVVYVGQRAVDEVSTRFGIRVLGYVPDKGYTINGEFINIHGVNRRQDYGYLGDAVPDSVQRRDMEIIKGLGANFVRTAHYPQAKSVLDAADELGILIWEEIPNIKIYEYSPVPAKNKDSRFTRKYIDNCLRAMEEMIARDRNHPSIMIWGIGDDLTGYPYLEDLAEMHERAHDLDPTRWTAGRVHPSITDVKDACNWEGYNPLQLAHRHPEWKWVWNEWGAFANERGILDEPWRKSRGEESSRKRAENEQGIEDELRQARTQALENTNEGGENFIPSELRAAIYQEASWLKFEAMPWMASAKWEMFDAGSPTTQLTKGIGFFYGPPDKRPWGVRFTGGDYRGLSDLWRIPKASYWFLKAQWTDTPFVYIVGHWTWPGQEGQPRMVRVYSTCDEVELFLNGKSLGRRTPEATEVLFKEWDDYGMWIAEFLPNPQGFKLRHGPFVWQGVPYEPGPLLAVGTHAGRQYQDQRKTAGTPYQIILKPDRDVIAAGGREAVRIVATIEDRDGVMVPSSNAWLTFHADGPGDLLGSPVFDAVWGMGAINIQSRGGDGTIVITASSRGLKEGKCIIASRKSE